MKIGDFAIWTSAAEAKALGCTRHARMWGVIPGFYGEAESLWIPRSDCFNWFEDLIMTFVALGAAWRDEEPVFGFEIREEIE